MRQYSTWTIPLADSAHAPVFQSLVAAAAEEDIAMQTEDRVPSAPPQASIMPCVPSASPHASIMPSVSSASPHASIPCGPLPSVGVDDAMQVDDEGGGNCSAAVAQATAVDDAMQTEEGGGGGGSASAAAAAAAANLDGLLAQLLDLRGRCALACSILGEGGPEEKQVRIRF